MKWLFHLAILAFIWSIYYLAMRATGKMLTVADVLVCGIVIAFSIGTLVYGLCKKYKQKHKKIRFPFYLRTQ